MQSRLVRLSVWLIGFLLYIGLCWQLVELQTEVGHARVDQTLLLLWAGGLLALVLFPPDAVSHLGLRLASLRVVWLNVGAVALALLTPGPSRFLLLSVPFIGIAFASTRLSPLEVVVSALAGWLTYVIVLVALIQGTDVDVQMELIAFGLFSLSLAAMVASGVEIAALHRQLVWQRQGLQQNLERMRTAVFQDELTGVFNRRFVMEVLAREIAYVDRERTSLAVCYCDLDHFKSVNDQFGHAGGDLALQNFAQLAGSLVRSADYVARLGGEEFLLVLVGANAERARNVAQRLCVRTRALHTPSDLGSVQFTVSCGVTAYRRGEGLTALLARADQALYQAKHGGRDQVVMT